MILPKPKRDQAPLQPMINGREALLELQKSALAALQAGHQAYLAAYARQDPETEQLHLRNHQLDAIAARLEAAILRQVGEDLLSLASRAKQAQATLARQLAQLQALANTAATVAKIAASLDKIITILAKVLG